MAEISTSFNLGGLPYGNHFEYATDIKDYIALFTVVSETFGYLTTPFIAAVEREDEAIKQISWSDLTEPIAKNDEIRDKALETLKDLVRGYMRFAPTEQMTEDAKKVWRQMKNYDVNPNAQYDRETGMMTNLIQALEANCAEEMERLHVDAIVAQMKEANEQVHKLLLDRDIEYGGRKHEAVARARRETDTLYYALRNSVNAYALVDPEGIFTPFINSVNATIKRLNEQVFKINSTTSGSGSGEGEEVDSDVDSDTDTDTDSEGEQEQETTPTKYTATFIANGSTVATQEYEAGEVIQAPDAPSGYEWEDYPYRMPAENITVNAVRKNIPGGGGGSGFE